MEKSSHKIINSNELISDVYLDQLDGAKIIVDCGHTPLSLDGTDLVFGRNENPSDSEVLTLKIGVSVFHRLKEADKKPVLSICFSDTTRFFSDPEQRPRVKKLCESGEMYDFLPGVYRDILGTITKGECVFTLQTVNSNRFTRIIKKVKKDVRSINDDEQTFSKYNVLFARDHLDTLFCFTNEFLLDTSNEEVLLDGPWWLDEFSTLHPSDSVKAPIASLKKFGIISLYSRATGILCPATYGGLISNFVGHVDHIAIYSRHDDPSVGEKIIRGIVSVCVLSQPALRSKKFLQIILNESKQDTMSEYAEISLLSSEEVNQKKESYVSLKELFKSKLSYRYHPFI